MAHLKAREVAIGVHHAEHVLALSKNVRSAQCTDVLRKLAPVLAAQKDSTAQDLARRITAVSAFCQHRGVDRERTRLGRDSNAARPSDRGEGRCRVLGHTEPRPGPMLAGEHMIAVWVPDFGCRRMSAQENTG